MRGWGGGGRGVDWMVGGVQGVGAGCGVGSFDRSSLLENKVRAFWWHLTLAALGVESPRAGAMIEPAHIFFLPSAGWSMWTLLMHGTFLDSVA